ncbi:MAG TPA: hypothetical protein VIN59_08990 [Alphaproteobacteria bacterium]
MEYTSLKHLWEQHAVNITAYAAQHGQEKILPGIFCDCAGTLFDHQDKIKPEILDFFQNTRKERKWDGYIISSDLKRFMLQLMDVKLDPMTTPMHDKKNLKGFMVDGYAMEFLLDDDLKPALPHVTHIEPNNLLKILRLTV